MGTSIAVVGPGAVGATVAAGALAIPVEPIPGLDALYDIGVPIALLW